MDHAAPFQSCWATTPVSESGQPDWNSDQYLRAGTWSDDTVWVYSDPSDTTAAEKRADDNWGKLYQAILDFNQPPSVAANALQFQEEIPALEGGSGSALTPPLSNDFDWSIPFPVYGGNEAPVSQFGIAPVNTAAPSPRTEDNDAASERREPLQLTRDIYSGPPAPGSDADQ